MAENLGPQTSLSLKTRILRARKDGGKGLNKTLARKRTQAPIYFLCFLDWNHECWRGPVRGKLWSTGCQPLMMSITSYSIEHTSWHKLHSRRIEARKKMLVHIVRSTVQATSWQHTSKKQLASETLNLPIFEAKQATGARGAITIPGWHCLLVAKILVNSTAHTGAQPYADLPSFSLKMQISFVH